MFIPQLIAEFPEIDSVIAHKKIHTPYFFKYQSVEHLQSILQTAYPYFLEVGGYTSLDISLTGLLQQKPDFALCMTTGSAYQASLACTVSASLNQRFGLREPKVMHIDTCLQEAVMNALIHGNLSIDSDFTSLQGFDAYYSLISMRLKCDPYKFRRVSIAAWDYDTYLQIAVIDQGSGIKPSVADANDILPHGRGLHLIRTLADHVWFGDDLRSIYMIFNHD
jgi:anti-sigma regulatory factor (Ser/Thr protein kinase)